MITSVYYLVWYLDIIHVNVHMSNIIIWMLHMYHIRDFVGSQDGWAGFFSHVLVNTFILFSFQQFLLTMAFMECIY